MAVSRRGDGVGLDDCPADESFPCESLEKRAELESKLATIMEAFVDGDALAYVRKCLKQQAYPASVKDEDKETMIPKPIRDQANGWAALCMAVRQARLDALNEHERQLEEERLQAASATGTRTLAAFEDDLVRIGAALFIAKPVFENWLHALPTATAKAKQLHDMQVLSVEDWLTLANASPALPEREEAVQRSLRICRSVQTPIWARIVRRLAANGEAITMQSVSAGLDDETMRIMSSDTTAAADQRKSMPAATSGQEASVADHSRSCERIPLFDAGGLSPAVAPSEDASSAPAAAASGSGAADEEPDDDRLRAWGVSSVFVTPGAAMPTAAAAGEAGQHVRITIGDHRRKLAPIQILAEVGLTERVSAPRKLLPSGHGLVILTGTNPGADVKMACSLINSRIADARKGDWPSTLPPELRDVTVSALDLDGKQYIAWCLNNPGFTTTPLETEFGELPSVGQAGEAALTLSLGISPSVEEIVNSVAPLASVVTAEFTARGSIPAEFCDYIANMAKVHAEKDNKNGARAARILAIALAYSALGAKLEVTLPAASAATAAVRSVFSAVGHDKSVQASIADMFAVGPLRSVIVHFLATAADEVDGPIAACVMRTVATIESLHFFSGPIVVRMTAKGLTVPYLTEAADLWMQPKFRQEAEDAKLRVRKTVGRVT